jgi:hypothetical protein
VLLIEGSHSVLAAEIFITTPVGAAGRRVIDSQLRIGGPVRDMLMLRGFAVIVEMVRRGGLRRVVRRGAPDYSVGVGVDVEGPEFAVQR